MNVVNLLMLTLALLTNVNLRNQTPKSVNDHIRAPTAEDVINHFCNFNDYAFFSVEGLSVFVCAFQLNSIAAVSLL